jgi:CopG family nickel-responsive transcriptional regulator
MKRISRFGVSLGKELLEDFDKLVKNCNYPTRSKAIEDLIRAEIIKKRWIVARYIVGAIILVYNHHRRELVNKITTTQHNFQDMIVSSQHIHLDKDNCLEIIVIKGSPKDMERLLYSLKSVKGVKNAALHVATIKDSSEL